MSQHLTPKQEVQTRPYDQWSWPAWEFWQQACYLQIGKAATLDVLRAIKAKIKDKLEFLNVENPEIHAQVLGKIDDKEYDFAMVATPQQASSAVDSHHPAAGLSGSAKGFSGESQPTDISTENKSSDVVPTGYGTAPTGAGYTAISPQPNHDDAFLKEPAKRNDAESSTPNFSKPQRHAPEETPPPQDTGPGFTYKQWSPMEWANWKRATISRMAKCKTAAELLVIAKETEEHRAHYETIDPLGYHDLELRGIKINNKLCPSNFIVDPGEFKPGWETSTGPFYAYYQSSIRPSSYREFDNKEDALVYLQAIPGVAIGICDKMASIQEGTGPNWLWVASKHLKWECK